MLTDDDIKDMRARATAWATDKHTGIRVTRERAIGEDHMALDVLELIDEVERLRTALAGAVCMLEDAVQLRDDAEHSRGWNAAGMSSVL